MNPSPPPPLPFTLSEIPVNDQREWLLAAFGWFLQHFCSDASKVAIFEEGKDDLPESVGRCTERANSLFVLQELAMLASNGWSLRLKDGTGVRFCLSAQLVDEDGNQLMNTVINRETRKFLPEYWAEWSDGSFPWGKQPDKQPGCL